MCIAFWVKATFDNIDSEDVEWQPDYLDYCESKLEEIDEDVDYEYVDYNYEIKKERKPKMPKVKREPGSKSHRCEICAGEFSNSSHLNRQKYSRLR